VQFPHGIVQGSPSSWQAEADFQTQWRPVFNLAVGGLSFLFLIGGLIGIYLLWYLKGRDKPVDLVADYLAEPPSDLPASVAGTLIDEGADMRDVIAGIVDLARQGAIRMEEEEEPGFLGIGTHREFTFTLLDESKATRPFEIMLIEGVFKGHRTRKLSDLRNKFYKTVPKIQEQLYHDVVKEGYFSDSPKKIRSRYVILGGCSLAIAVPLGFFATPILAGFTDAAFCVPVALGIVAAAMLIVGRFMPAKTEKGAEETAKMACFRALPEEHRKVHRPPGSQGPL